MWSRLLLHIAFAECGSLGLLELKAEKGAPEGRSLEYELGACDMEQYVYSVTPQHAKLCCHNQSVSIASCAGVTHIAVEEPIRWGRSEQEPPVQVDSGKH